MITIALSKGRLASKILDMFKELEICDITLDDDDRRLIIESPDGNYRFFLAKPSDVPTFVDYGVADMGVVGKDTIVEENRNITEMLDLGFGKCRMCVCAKKENLNDWKNLNLVRVATKYPHIAKEYFDSIGKNANIIKLNGSVELGPITGLSDVIVDIVESGRTLKENGLDVSEVVVDLSARLIINNASLKTKYDEISQIVEGLEKIVSSKNK